MRARKGCIDAIILSKPPLGVASLRSNLSFLVIFMTKARSLRSSRPQILSLRAKRGNLSFDCPPTPNNRDRHVPRDRKSCHCEPARQSLISGSLRDKGEIATFLAMTGVFCQSPLWRLRAILSLRACEAISLFCLPSLEQPRSLRSARLYFLSLRVKRGNLSFLVIFMTKARSPRSSR